MITVSDTSLSEVKLIKVPVFKDERGFFSENYRAPLYVQNGIDVAFVQDNLSFSKKGTIRGMHFQFGTPGQAKLISVIQGIIYDVFVDIRPESNNFGKWGAYELDAQKREQLFIPAGFAHGFAALTEALVLYKVSTPFNPETERTILYNDPKIGIAWPISSPILSERDRNAPSLQEVLG